MITVRRALLLLGLTVASLGAFTQNASAAPIVLDAFTAAPGSWSTGTAPGVLQSQGVAGSPRTLTLNPPGLANGGDFLGVGGGQFSFQSNSSSTYSAALSYDLGASLPFQTTDFLKFQFLSLDGGSGLTDKISTELKVFTDTGTLTKNILFTEGTFNYNIDFNGLSGAGNLSGTTGIQLTFNNINDQGVDFVLGGNGLIIIRENPVPEPATLATFGLMGLVGGFAARRKMKARAATQA